MVISRSPNVDTSCLMLTLEVLSQSPRIRRNKDVHAGHARIFRYRQKLKMKTLVEQGRLLCCRSELRLEITLRCGQSFRYVKTKIFYQKCLPLRVWVGDNKDLHVQHMHSRHEPKQGHEPSAQNHPQTCNPSLMCQPPTVSPPHPTPGQLMCCPPPWNGWLFAEISPYSLLKHCQQHCSLPLCICL